MRRFAVMATVILAVLTCNALAAGDRFLEAPVLPRPHFVIRELEQEGSRAVFEWGKLEVYWQRGLRINYGDNLLRAQIGGRIFLDAVAMAADRQLKDVLGDVAEPVDVTQLRLNAVGLVGKHVLFKIHFGFSDENAAIKDGFVELHDIPYIDNFRAGYFREPFGLEHQVSMLFNTFMVRALPNAMSPGRSSGFMTYSTFLGNSAGYQLGIFRASEDVFADYEETYGLTGRVFYRPIDEQSGSKLLHVGISYSSRWTDGTGETRYRTPPESELVDDFLDTRKFDTDGIQLFGAEATAVDGPYSLQGEIVVAKVRRPGAGDVQFEGAYLQGSWFLTGEHRSYRNRTGTFGRVVPKRPFILRHNEGPRGPGAWEVAARLSYLNLSDKDIRGGRLQDATFGVNWYLHKHIRVMANYVAAFADAQGINDVAHVFQIRFQMDI